MLIINIYCVLHWSVSIELCTCIYLLSELNIDWSTNWLSASCKPWQKGITDILIVCQLYSFDMGEQHVLDRLVHQEVYMQSLNILSVDMKRFFKNTKFDVAFYQGLALNFAYGALTLSSAFCGISKALGFVLRTCDYDLVPLRLVAAASNIKWGVFDKD